MKRKTLLLGLGAAALTAACARGRVLVDQERADLVLRGGGICTSRKDGAIAEAIAVGGDRILAVGSRATIDGYIGPRTRVLDLHGGMVLPGFIDTHTHFVWGSLARTRVALSDAANPEEVERRLAAYARTHPHEAWILGGDWEYGTFPPSGLPTKALLDRVIPDRPVALDSFDGHSMWLNSKALALAGITRSTPDIVKNGRLVGIIVRDPATGEATGVLKEVAQNLALAVIPKPTRNRMLGLLRDGIRAANARGVTSVVNASGDLNEMDLYHTLHLRRELTLRMTTAYADINAKPHTLSPAELEAFEEARRRYTGDWVRAGIVKFFMDGVVEGHTAALLKPYANANTRARTYYPSDQYARMLIELDRRGFAVMTHTIGDAAVREALDGYEAAIKANGPRDRRWRIEHIEVSDPNDIPRFAKLGIIASMQPYHSCCHDGHGGDTWSRNLGPKRWNRGFVWRDIADTGAMLIHGSDWPVVTIDPLVGIYSALTREDPNGIPVGGWFPRQRLHLDEVLAGYTRNAAFAAFMEDRIGTLEPGKKADLVALDKDLRKISPSEVLNTQISATVVGGRMVYEGGEHPNRTAEIPKRSDGACACRRFARPIA